MRWHRGQRGYQRLYRDLPDDGYGRRGYVVIRPCPPSLFLTYLVGDDRRPGYVVEVVRVGFSGGRSRDLQGWAQLQRKARELAETVWAEAAADVTQDSTGVPVMGAP